MTVTSEEVASTLTAMNVRRGFSEGSQEEPVIAIYTRMLKAGLLVWNGATEVAGNAPKLHGTFSELFRRRSMGKCSLMMMGLYDGKTDQASVTKGVKASLTAGFGEASQIIISQTAAFRFFYLDKHTEIDFELAKV